jgi:MoaA/NifB/PqqE/SkfB family radical SAM enzyme
MGKAPEQTVEQFARGAENLSKWGSILVSLAGGEPLLRDDIADIVRAIGKYHFPFMTTNGFLADDGIAKSLFEAGLWGVSVSIDYADAQRHDKARGRENAWARAVNALETFSRNRKYKWQRVNLMCVLLDDNLDQVEDLIKLAAEHDAYFMIQPYSELKTGSKKFIYSGEQSASWRLLELRRKYPNFLSNPTFLSKFDSFRSAGVANCAAGRAFFNIDSTGDIAICVENRPSPVANLYADDAATVHRKLRQGAKGNKCRRCWYNCRGEVESLYNFRGLMQSLPTLLFDRGKPGQ